MEKPKTIEDFKEITNTHMELVEFLHNKCMDKIEGKVLPKEEFQELWDLVYRHFEP